ncbi:MAG: APC family permease [Halobacteriovoraceae bacterium]|nr:APC family permease [Halobacteriovoraceae bacterium]MCB9093771.1 APC family permease [Halobacteriovoraceae bacterium]
MKKLERSLNLKSVIVISLSAMLGSGLFVLPGLVVTQTGPSIWFSYLIAALCVLPAAISKAELATAMPSSGGTYVYLERTFGPFFGTIAGIGLWLSLLLKSSFALIGLGAYLSYIAHVPLIETAIIISLVIMVINILGVSKVSKLLSVILFVMLASIGGLCLWAMVVRETSSTVVHETFFSNGLGGFFRSTATVFVAFAGVTKVAAIAEEVKNPGRNLPRGILISLFVATVVYCGVTFVLSKVIPLNELAGDIKPIITLGLKVGGENLGYFAAIIAIITMASVANAGVLAASRFPFAMARDQLLPPILGKLASSFLTPVWSIVISSLIVMASIVLLEVDSIAKFASTFMIIIYGLESVAVIVLRENRVQWYQPEYKTRFYPFVQIFGILTSLALLLYMGVIVVKALLVISIPGLLLYFIYGRPRVNRKGVVGIRAKRKDLTEVAPIIHHVENIDLTVGANVVVAFFGKQKASDMLVEIGVALSDRGNLEVVHLTEIPEQTDLDDIGDEPAYIRSLRRRVKAISDQFQTPITFEDIATHDMYKSIHEISLGLHCEWLVTSWQGRARDALTFHDPIGWLRDHLHCNVITFRDAGVRYIKKVMVIVRNHESDARVIDTADHFADVAGASLTVTKFVKKNDSDEIKDMYHKKISQICETCRSENRSINFLTGEKEVDAFVTASIEFDLLVFGAFPESGVKKLLHSEQDRLMAKAGCSVVALQLRSGSVS